MGYIQGEGRNQATRFPVVLDDFVAGDHVCRVQAVRAMSLIAIRMFVLATRGCCARALRGSIGTRFAAAWHG
jgi:hypothetical protein